MRGGWPQAPLFGDEMKPLRLPPLHGCMLLIIIHV